MTALLSCKIKVLRRDHQFMYVVQADSQITAILWIYRLQVCITL